MPSDLIITPIYMTFWNSQRHTGFPIPRQLTQRMKRRCWSQHCKLATLGRGSFMTWFFAYEHKHVVGYLLRDGITFTQSMIVSYLGLENLAQLLLRGNIDVNEKSRAAAKWPTRTALSTADSLSKNPDFKKSWGEGDFSSFKNRSKSLQKKSISLHLVKLVLMMLVYNTPKQSLFPKIFNKDATRSVIH